MPINSDRKMKGRKNEQQKGKEYLPEFKFKVVLEMLKQEAHK